MLRDVVIIIFLVINEKICTGEKLRGWYIPPNLNKDDKYLFYGMTLKEPLFSGKEFEEEVTVFSQSS